MTRSTTMRLTEECRARLIGIAAANGVSMSAMIERMVREWKEDGGVV